MSEAEFVFFLMITAIALVAVFVVFGALRGVKPYRARDTDQR